MTVVSGVFTIGGIDVHTAVREYVAKHCPGRWAHVIEVGARDVNGGIRDLIDTDSYVGVDLVAGPGVQHVGDVREYQPTQLADLVLCLEVAEHDPDPLSLFQACCRLLRPGGVFVMTCATGGRAPHSAGDGGPLAPGEWYGNVPASTVLAAVRGVPLRLRDMVVDPAAGDLRAVIVKDV